MMPESDDAAWEMRLVWESIDEREPDDFVARMSGLVAELPPESPIGAFECAAALDSTGRSDLAVSLYERALSLGRTCRAISVRWAPTRGSSATGTRRDGGSRPRRRGASSGR